MQNRDRLLASIGKGLEIALGRAGRLRWHGSLAGGDINRAALLSDGRSRWFLKYHADPPPGMFAAEALALAEISGQGCLRVPEPVAHGCVDGTGWLVLEYVEMRHTGPEALLGEQLAALHRVHAEAYGWQRDNFIGSTPQLNLLREDWQTFWQDCRLGPQLELARVNGFGDLADTGGRLLEAVPRLLDGRGPAASLLHGDLWSGNKAYDPKGQPVIFDPATYYGDRETDIAMTELFGGFGPDFYAAYEAAYPLDDGYQVRRDLYNLYHLLNHLNLFGGGYLARCEQVIAQLLAQLT
jgi:fructosamine-3-kinase